MRYSAKFKRDFVKKVLAGKQPVSWYCKRHGVSRKSFYDWLSRGKFLSKKKTYKKGLRSKVKRGDRHWKAISGKIKDRIINIVIAYPEWGVRKIASVLKGQGFDISSSGVYAFFKKEGLNTQEKRKELASNFAVKKEVGKDYSSLPRLDPKVRRLLASRLSEGVEPASVMAGDYKVSPRSIYRWKKRMDGGDEALEDRTVSGEEHYRAVSPGLVEAILKLVAKRPQLSTHKIARQLAGEYL